MNTPAWLQQRKEIPSEVLTLIKTARTNSCWIFHIKKNNFYTPEEFEACWKTVVSWDNKLNNFAEFKIVTPIYAVRSCATWLRLTNEKFQNVIQKFDQYEASFSLRKNK